MNLLVLFCHHIGGCGTAIINDGQTITMLALLSIDVYRNDTIMHCINRQQQPFELLNDAKTLQHVKEMTEVMQAINEGHYVQQNLDADQAFAALEQVHLQYWKNEDPYFFPSLCWPCRYGSPGAEGWQLMLLRQSNRLFVVYPDRTPGLSHPS